MGLYHDMGRRENEPRQVERRPNHEFQGDETLAGTVTTIETLGTMARPGRGVAHLLFASTRSPPRPLDALESLLDPGERERADRFLVESDRRVFVASHGILHLVLGAFLGRDPARLCIRQAQDEKPRLADDGPTLDFNLSHSGDLAMIGVATAPVGVDVEQIRDVPDLDRLIAGTLAPDEAAGLMAISQEHRQDAFYACWTCKEAVTKALGRGLSMPLDSFVVETSPLRDPALRALEGSSEAARDWSLWSQSPVAGYRAAAAIAAAGISFEAHRLA